MRIAIPVWNDNIAPVLDTSTELRTFAVEESIFTDTGTVSLPAVRHRMATFIADTADVLICGALSGCLEQELRALSVTVHPWVMGNADSIIGAYTGGGIAQHEYTMPGCGRRGRRGCGGRGRGRRHGAI